MIAPLKTPPLQQPCPREPASDRWADPFEAMLPEITRYACASFRQLDREAREEAMQEAIAHALVTYRRLVEQGKVDIAYPAVLARCGVWRVKDGRKVGGCRNGQDVLSEHGQRRRHIAVGRLDRFDEHRGCWRQIVVEDRHADPAEVACLRIDFADWLDLQPKRNRQLAESLAVGYTPGELARRFGVSAARISHLRRALRESWHAFQGEEPAAATA